ncbi:glycolate oxidase subunit GlcE [Alkalilimnicola sp. S0819]|uniref:glycolate oxidase subunit GlcE n=1 Tax=Alkalilimnicola sp. S0819 TaxID=2613922 RepID=UPI001261F8F3|nr:glycolate oxidase subunit GlcE [Alkalilimnicola sp. S0819]KAB7619753.1 glycolate oxidase subunit GlcE [Alkalilimnicola sp. S0819]MPQ17517.1 glycolate oxidase subunit GlcE [Alkalilimnicola sp. S0819]
MAEDQIQQLSERVRAAAQAREALEIRGQGSKAFYGRPVAGAPLELSGYRGVVSYEPTELYITARAGTPLSELEAVLAEQHQMLPFEPPRFGGAGTIGGAIATGLSGPRRPFAGAARDFVLGVRCLNGQGEDLRFGGQVMKNVAGYDLSRLISGSLGTLGVLLEVSLKVLPRPRFEQSLSLDLPLAEGLAQADRWVGENLPLSGCAHDGERLHIRLSGAEPAVQAAARRIGGDTLDKSWWDGLRDHSLPFFRVDAPLWRLSLPPGARPTLSGEALHDWGGRQIWLRAAPDAHELQGLAARHGGHATLFRGPQDTETPVFQPLSAPLMALHRRLKQSLDPQGILNPGRLYPGL